MHHMANTFEVLFPWKMLMTKTWASCVSTVFDCKQLKYSTV